MLVDAFMKSGLVGDAFKLFGEMPEKSCHLDFNDTRVRFLFVKMMKADLIPNDFTFSAVLQACADLAALRFVDQLISLIIQSELESDSRIRICLMDFYS